MVQTELRVAARPLPDVPAGVALRVSEIATDDSDDCRLRELGLYEGARLEVISQGDPVVLRVFGNRFAVCRRCAEHISVAVLG